MPIAESVSASAAKMDSRTLVNRGVASAAHDVLHRPHVGHGKVRIDLADRAADLGVSAGGSPSVLMTSVIERIRLALPSDLCHCECGM